MQDVYAFTVICFIWGISEFISIKTKSFLPSLFLSSIIFLIGFQTGILPKTIFVDSSLLTFGAVMVGMMIVHLGTMISIDELVSQWKTVLIALMAVLGVFIFVIVVGLPLVGKNFALASIGPITGGTIASILVGEAGTAAGLPDIAIFATVIITIQGFVGLPLSSILLKREAKSIIKQFHQGQLVLDDEVKQVKRKKLIPPLDSKYQTTAIYFLKMGLVVILSIQIERLTLGYVNRYVACLILGVLFQELGALEKNIMEKANALGIVMIGIMVLVFGPLINADIDSLIRLIKPLLITFSAGVIGIFIFSFIAGKFLGYSPRMAIVIGLTCLYGFPGTFILTNEIASTVSSNDEEKEIVIKQVLPKMLIAGFVTVTISSVLIAGILTKFIG